MALCENAELELVLEDTIKFVEYFAAKVDPGHICGPEGNCDCNCMIAARDAELLGRLRNELSKIRRTKC